jgi:uncharacterized protein (DUF1810 family)
MEFEIFEQAQAITYEAALMELTKGHKQKHWMWFFFPQLEGIGKSEISQKFALDDIQHARDYLAHPLLGERLLRFTEVCCSHEGLTAKDIFAHDSIKFHSCMSLFALSHPDNEVFNRAIKQFFAGLYCQKTLQILRDHGELEY